VIHVNPFDLPGPEFLVFYIILTIAVAIGLVVSRRQLESGPTPRLDVSDPLLIAFLRGGHAEAMRVATVSLIDRGLLTCTSKTIESAKHANAASVRRPIEKELLRKFSASGQAASMFTDDALKSTFDEYEQRLRELRLLPDDYIDRGRQVIFGIALVILGGVSGLKILIALSRGRTNVFFLIILTVIAIYIVTKLSFPRLTQTAKNLLADLKQIYWDLKSRASLIQPGGATLEPMMLAAVFGVGALSGNAFSYARTLFPKADSGAGTWGASCGSSCGGGSSCGSSCGGGGCGGGCGGCGS
jgi:uncharacterized protein (TIGR04222 family)